MTFGRDVAPEAGHVERAIRGLMRVRMHRLQPAGARRGGLALPRHLAPARIAVDAIGVGIGLQDADRQMVRHEAQAPLAVANLRIRQQLRDEIGHLHR